VCEEARQWLAKEMASLKELRKGCLTVRTESWLPSRLSRNNVLAHSTAVPLHQPKPLVHLQHAVLLEYTVASECFFFRKPKR
jgi:hypothetical protein